MEDAQTAMVRIVRFYEVDTDLWHVVTAAGDTANDNARPFLHRHTSRKRSYLSPPKVHIRIVYRRARACVSFEGWKARVTANTSVAVRKYSIIRGNQLGLIKPKKETRNVNPFQCRTLNKLRYRFCTLNVTLFRWLLLKNIVNIIQFKCVELTVIRDLLQPTLNF